MSWFKKLFGVAERNGNISLRNGFRLSADNLQVTAPNGKTFQCGAFSTPSVRQLRQEVVDLIGRRDAARAKKCSYDHLPIRDAMEIHVQHPHSIIQAASQFNCLEFPSPNVVPEDGIEQYESDYTQGPACALACPAGTLFRNYFATVDGQIGQTADRQINNLDQLELLLSNAKNRYFYVRNGYVFTESEASLQALNSRLENMSERQLDEFRQAIKIGVQEDTQVSFIRRGEAVPEDLGLITVTQAYCSALSCGYSGVPNELWERLARLVLEAAYEATILVAVKKALIRELMGDTSEKDDPRSQDGDTYKDVFLTAVGGGVFANDMTWISDAIGRAIAIAETYEVDLRIHVCHFRSIKGDFRNSVDSSYRQFSQQDK